MQRRRLFAVLTLAITVTVSSADAVAAADPWQLKVVPSVLRHDPGAARDFFIYLDDQADLSGASWCGDKAARGRFVYDALRDAADRSQPAILRTLAGLGVEARPYWIVNAILVRADLTVLELMARRPDVAAIYGNPAGPSSLPRAEASQRAAPPGRGHICENLLTIGAPEVWAAGTTGEGVVIGLLDTGADWQHEALRGRYRGWDGDTADHDYNWFDALGTSSDVPIDEHGHGTITLGVMVADNQGPYQTAVAPGAQWIACRGGSLEETLEWWLAGLQWMLAPTQTDGSNPDPSRAPDIVQNSWGCFGFDGCEDPLVLLPAFTALRAAGIFANAAAGNWGPLCSTVDFAPAIYDEAFTVGSVTSGDGIWYFSSRGPAILDGSGRLKPDVTAPEAEYSTLVGGGFGGSFPQTSWTSPQGSGVAALLISGHPGLRGDVDRLEEIMQLSALPRTSDQECGGVPGSEVPNNTYGWGRIDAAAADQVAAHEAVVRVTGDQQVLAAAAEVVFGDIAITHLGSEVETFDLTLDTALLPPGWSAWFLHEGGAHPVLSVLLAPGETALVNVVMAVGDSGSGQVTAAVTREGDGRETIATENFAALVGGTEILVVADDGDAGLGYSLYGPAVASTGRSWSVWDRGHGEIPAGVLTGFDAVVWETGRWANVLDAADRAVLDEYLALDRPLLLAGDDILESLYDQGGAARLWYQLKMRLGYASGTSDDLTVAGVPGTFGDGLAFALAGGDPDQLALLAGQPVQVAFTFGDGDPAATRTDYSGYTLLYLAFGLESVPTQAEQFALVDAALDELLFDPTPAPAVPPAVTTLAQNSPNPFNPETRIAFTTAKPGRVTLEIFDARGRLVRVLNDEILPAGAYESAWRGRTDGGQQAPSGTYFYRLVAGDRTLTRKLTLVK